MQTRQTIALASLLAAATLTTGCGPFAGLKPGGPQRSIDEYTYVSTPWEPLTVTLYDRREDMPLWTVDVPVGSKVSIRFYAEKNDAGTNRLPDLMRWEIFDDSKNYSRLSNSMSVPGPDARLLQVSLRKDTPQFPDEDAPEPTFNDPDRTFLPVQPKRYRGVPVESPQGTYYKAD